MYNIKADYLKESWTVIHVGEKIFQEKGINCQWHNEADKILEKKSISYKNLAYMDQFVLIENFVFLTVQ